LSLSFERGSYDQPKGHALAYMRLLEGQEKVLATYIIVLPIVMDFAKYLPPLLAPHLGNIPVREFSAFAIPPVPEQVEGHHVLKGLADLRDDDLVYIGDTLSMDIPSIMQAVNEAVQEYAQRWIDYSKSEASRQPEKEPEALMGVDEVLYSLMGERDKVNELAKLMSRLRFAVEMRDQNAAREAMDAIQLLGRYLPSRYQLESLVEAAQDPSAKGGRLAQLYLERCYKLAEGDEEAARGLEMQIQQVKSSG